MCLGFDNYFGLAIFFSIFLVNFVHNRNFNLNIVGIYKDIVAPHNADISDHQNMETVIEIDRGTELFIKSMD